MVLRNEYVETYFELIQDAIKFIDHTPSTIQNNVFYKPIQGRIPTCQELLELVTKEVKSIVYTCRNIVTK